MPDVDVEDLVETGLEVRSFVPDLEVRSTRKGREVSGIAVPWDVEAVIDDYLIEGFRKGAFDHQLSAWNRVAFAREHIIKGGVLIGRGVEARNDAAGLFVRMLASRTPVGEETAQLLDDGALRHLSVAFMPRLRDVQPSRLVEGRSAVWRTKVDAREIAVVLEGAYGDLASALAVRHKREAEAPRPGMAEAQRVLDQLPPLPPPPAVTY